ncbi:MAG TPA: class I SAM-dependent methyltransferase [Candidatus Koribacter sp.]
MSETAKGDWNDFARMNASQRWRKPSAMMGHSMTEAIVAAAEVVPNLRVLDVACGTGEPAISIATAMKGTGMVMATDVSDSPLKIGEGRAKERKLTNIQFQKADVHALPFPDETFERVTSRLGVMFFSDLPKALREIHRVLTPGGHVTLLAWGPMEQPYFDLTAGTVRRLLPQLEVSSFARSMFEFGDHPGKLASGLQDAGFLQIDERQCTVAWNWPGTPEDMWAYFQDVTIPFKPMLSAIPNAQREQVNAAVLEALRERYDGEQVHFDAHIVLATATR